MSLEQALNDHSKLLERNNELLGANTKELARHNDLVEKLLSTASGRAVVAATPSTEPPKTETRGRKSNAEKEAEAKAAADKAAADKAAAEKPKDAEPVREQRPPREPATGADKEANDFYSACEKFLDHGGETREDEDERDHRKDFVQDVVDELGVKRLSELDPKQFRKVLRWMRIYERGDKVDFKND